MKLTNILAINNLNRYEATKATPRNNSRKTRSAVSTGSCKKSPVRPVL